MFTLTLKFERKNKIYLLPTYTDFVVDVMETQHSLILESDSVFESGQIGFFFQNGWTALHCAAYWSKPDVVKCLLKYGADVHIQNKVSLQVIYPLNTLT